MIMAANLAPRKMKFGVSEGMILAAGPGGKDVFAFVKTIAKPPQSIDQITGRQGLQRPPGHGAQYLENVCQRFKNLLNSAVSE